MENFIDQFNADSNAHALLKRIHKKLDSTFLPMYVQKEATEVRRCYEEAEQQYFEKRIIMDAVIKASYSQLTNEENIPSCYLNAIPKYASRCESSLPVSLDHVSKIVLNRKRSESDGEAYSVKVEAKIVGFCKKLCAYTGQILSQDWIKTLHYISTKADNMGIESSEPRSQKLALQKMLLTYYTELNEGLTSLKKLLSLYENKFDFESDLAQMFYLDSQCLLLKLRAFEWKVLNNTYTSESLPALRIISDGLDNRKETLDNEKDKLVIDLEAYKALGSEYITLAETYTQLTKKISKQKWAISTLASRTGLEQKNC